jgi:putative ABC transport system ATP-binding protein
MPEIVLETRALTKAYGEGATRIEAVRGVELIVRKGDLLAIMGPSGSGKSTLLNLLSGVETPSSGQVLLNGEDLAAMTDDARTLIRRRKLGFVFQHFNLLPVLSAEENVSLPLLLDGVSATEAQRRSLEALAQVGMEHRKTHRPGELSGGEQQRVAIARALAIEPILVLADEPTGNLDSQNGQQVIDLLQRLVTERGQTIVIVTHDSHVAEEVDVIVRMRDGLVESREVVARQVAR